MRTCSALWIQETCCGDVISLQLPLKADDKQMGSMCHLVLTVVKIATHIMLAGAFKLDVVILTYSFKLLFRKLRCL